ncbi:hypothetical protein ACFQJ5_17095 [Halomicroarcula sp. GCM10025324]|uniref:hypothetical protein n=2 Tax=Haloarcula TaxID=2237 RepID=UPI00360B5CEA
MSKLRVGIPRRGTAATPPTGRMAEKHGTDQPPEADATHRYDIPAAHPALDFLNIEGTPNPGYPRLREELLSN